MIKYEAHAEVSHVNRALFPSLCAMKFHFKGELSLDTDDVIESLPR